MRTLTLPGLPQPTVVERHARAARRLRLSVPGLVGDARLARAVESALRAEGLGVQSAVADPRSGRALVRYAPRAPLLRKLRDDEAPAPHPSEGAKEGGKKRRARRRVAHAHAEQGEAWHARPASDALIRLSSGPRGLTPGLVDQTTGSPITELVP